MWKDYYYDVWMPYVKWVRKYWLGMLIWVAIAEIGAFACIEGYGKLAHYINNRLDSRKEKES
jgi:hypothetical protein